MSVAFNSNITPLPFRSHTNTPLSNYTTPTHPLSSPDHFTKRSGNETSKKTNRVQTSAYREIDEEIRGDNSFVIEGWNKKSRRPSSNAPFNSQEENLLTSSQESLLEGTCQQNIFKNDLANLSNGLFSMQKKEIKKVKIIKPSTQTFTKTTSRPGTITYSNRPFTNQKIRSNFDKEMEVSNPELEKNEFSDDRLYEKVIDKEPQEEEKPKVKSIETQREKEDFKDLIIGKKPGSYRKNTAKPEYERTEKSPDSAKQAMGGGFMGIGRPVHTTSISFQKREPQNLKLYLKVIQLLEKTKAGAERPGATTELNSIHELPAPLNPQLSVVTGKKPRNEEKKLKRFLKPRNANVSMSILHKDQQEDAKKSTIERSYSLKKEVMTETIATSPHQDPKILFRPSHIAPTPKYPVIDYSSSRTTPTLPNSRPMTTVAYNRMNTQRIRKTNRSPSPNTRNQTAFNSCPMNQSPMVTRNQSAVFEGDSDSATKQRDYSSKQIRTVVPSNEASFRVPEDEFLPYYQQEKSYDMDLIPEGNQSGLKMHFRSSSFTHGKAWRQKESRQEVRGIKLQVYHLPLPMVEDAPSPEKSKRERSVKKLKRRDTAEMTVEDFFRKDGDTEVEENKGYDNREYMNGFSRVRKLLYSHTKRSSRQFVTENQESKEALKTSNEVVNRTEIMTAEPRQRTQRFATLEKLLSGNV